MATATPGRIFIGIAGWSYPDWDGYVYPSGLKEKLNFIAGFVDVIEINSTFYRPPDARMAASWLKQTESLPEFAFTAKLNQEITHEGKITPEMVSAIRSGFDPLTKAGKLRHLLAQFRYDFADAPEARDRLSAIKDKFGDMTNLTFELRHNSWQSPSAMEFLSSLNATVANLDYPTARDSFNLRECRIGEHAYLRLHGRNYKAWFDKKAGRDETYNYLYPPKELDEIRNRAVKLAGMSKSLTLIANNHYQGKEVVNALQLRAMMTGGKVPVPPLLAGKYPDLKEISRN